MSSPARTHITLRVLFVTLTGLLALVAGLVEAPSARAAAPAVEAKTAAYEAEFLSGMMDHHQMAVMMAKSCEERAVHAELRDLCGSIIATQSGEIRLMQTWLADWYGISHEPMMSTGEMKSMMKLDRLSAERYEVAFLKAMIRHHRAAIREATQCLDRAEHPQLLALCSAIGTSQLSEVATMQQWLSTWYHKALGRH